MKTAYPINGCIKRSEKRTLAKFTGYRRRLARRPRSSKIRCRDIWHSSAKRSFFFLRFEWPSFNGRLIILESKRGRRHYMALLEALSSPFFFGGWTGTVTAARRRMKSGNAAPEGKPLWAPFCSNPWPTKRPRVLQHTHNLPDAICILRRRRWRSWKLSIGRMTCSKNKTGLEVYWGEEPPCALLPLFWNTPPRVFTHLKGKPREQAIVFILISVLFCTIVL